MKITKRALLALLLVLIAAACFVTGISGPAVVNIGQTVTYDIAFETDSSGANGTAYVFFDVPADWTFVSATYDANVNGANVSGTPTTGVSSSGSPCVVLPLEAGYQRLGFSQTFPTVTANDSGVLHVTMNVGLAAGSYTLEATGAGSFGGPTQQCNATRSLNVTVNPEGPAPVPPRPQKSFSPSTIAPGGTSRLTFGIVNQNNQPITGVAFTDTYPAGLVNATPPNISSTCGGTPSSTANTLSLTGGTVPASSTCTVSIDVTAAAAGNYVNTVPTGTISSSSHGTNTQTATATLSVGAAPPASAAVPTASEWALLLMAAALVVVAMKMMR
jgi:uncharacterized repeat protein (TIGR01451 family)